MLVHVDHVGAPGELRRPLDAPGGRPDDARHHFSQRAFAAPAGAHQRHNRALCDRQIEARVQRPGAIRRGTVGEIHTAHAQRVLARRVLSETIAWSPAIKSFRTVSMAAIPEAKA